MPSVVVMLCMSGCELKQAEDFRRGALTLVALPVMFGYYIFSHVGGPGCRDSNSTGLTTFGYGHRGWW